MAIVQNFWLKGAKKRLAGAVLYEAMGQTRARELAPEVSNPRTQAQMNQRVKWSNLVNIYRANASWMKYAYENKKTNQSEYNKFMSLNVTSSRIFLTKQLASYGAAVVYPYIMTQGSLPSIEWQDATTAKISNILLDADTTFNTDLTVGELSRALLAYNPGIQSGDQLSFVRMTQLVNSSTGVPYVQVRKYEMLVNSNSTDRASLYLPVELFGNYTADNSHYLSFLGEGKTGGFLMILSRTIGGRTLVSSQEVIIFNNEQFINSYSNQDALDAAIKSYGESQDAFLSTISAEQSSNLQTEISLLGAYDGTNIYPSNTLRSDMGSLIGGQRKFIFNASLAGLGPYDVFASSINGDTATGTAVLDPTNDHVISCEWQEGSVTDPDARRFAVHITIGGVEYTYRYDRTDGGLE